MQYEQIIIDLMLNAFNFQILSIRIYKYEYKRMKEFKFNTLSRQTILFFFDNSRSNFLLVFVTIFKWQQVMLEFKCKHISFTVLPCTIYSLIFGFVIGTGKSVVTGGMTKPTVSVVLPSDRVTMFVSIYTQRYLLKST